MAQWLNEPECRSFVGKGTGISKEGPLYGEMFAQGQVDKQVGWLEYGTDVAAWISGPWIVCVHPQRPSAYKHWAIASTAFAEGPGPGARARVGPGWPTNRHRSGSENTAPEPWAQQGQQGPQRCACSCQSLDL